MVQPFKELFEREMTRKEFLQLFGVAVLSLFGVNNLLTYLLKQNQSAKKSSSVNASSTQGFGSRKFGE